MFRLMPHTRLVTLLLAAATACASGLVIPAVSQADNAIVEFSNVESSKCLQPVNESLGAAIVQETCNGSVAQQWTVKYNTASGIDTDRFETLTNRASNLCIDAFGGLSNGTPMVQWTCGSAPGTSISNEHWSFAPKADTSNPGELESGETPYTYSYCMSTPGVTNGNAMLLYSCDFANSELWTETAV